MKKRNYAHRMTKQYLFY